MTKNSLNTNGAAGKSEERAGGLTRVEELLHEANYLAHLGQASGFRTLSALAELKMVDAREQEAIDALSPAPAPAAGASATLITLAALERYRRGAP